MEKKKKGAQKMTCGESSIKAVIGKTYISRALKCLNESSGRRETDNITDGGDLVFMQYHSTVCLLQENDCV